MPRPQAAFARWLALALLPALAACSLVQLRQESQDFESATVLVGRIDCPAGAVRGLVVAAIAADGPRQGQLSHHTALHECGGYELVVPAGHHHVAAFDDANLNGRHDEGEALAEAADAVTASGSGVVMGIDLVLGRSAGAAARGRALGLDRLPPRGRSTQAGVVTTLDDPALSAVQGQQGYWAPMSSFRQQGGNIVFLEPFDPARVPVLFVHGAAGSPQDLAPLIAGLDRRHHQAWLFHYPSGAALDSMAHLLYWKLLNLQLRHRFTRWAVVAHSMGGLVVRQLLAGLGPELPPPQLFVSISTPWAGEPAAELGVRHAPAVVPSWHDLRPDSPFLAALHARPLPPALDHVLLFGHRGGYSLLRPNTDGTVTLASQLRPEAQAQARRVLGFDEDHMSILAAPAVSALLGTLLDQALHPGAAPAAGQLRVRLQRPPDLALGLPVLRLRPLQGGGVPMALPLAGDAGERPLGPLPPGRYEASLLGTAFTAQPRRSLVVIEAGGVAALDLALSPLGTLAGYAVDAGAAARPGAGTRVPAEARVRLQRITLRGPGVLRHLQPQERDDDEALIERLIDGQDAAGATVFNFVGLPAGDYELQVEADGFEPHRSRHRVEPGRAEPLQTLRLQRRGQAPR